MIRGKKGGKKTGAISVQGSCEEKKKEGVSNDVGRKRRRSVGLSAPEGKRKKVRER